MNAVFKFMDTHVGSGLCYYSALCSVPLNFLSHLTTANVMKKTAYAFCPKDELTTICVEKTPDFAD